MPTEPVLTLDWPALLGGGFAGSVLLLALVERLRRTFATRAEVDAVGRRYDALQALYLQARDAADEARERAASAEREQRNLAERLGERAVRPLERVGAKLESLGEAQAAQAAALEHLLQRLDRLESPPRAGRSAAR